MAPLTRSSAPSTPATPRAAADTDAQLTPTRRTPHCTKCHRPRAGHPRSGCPFVGVSSDPILPSTSTHKPASRSAGTSPEAADDSFLLEDLSSLQIVSPNEDKANASASVAMPPAGQKKRRRKLSVRFALVPEQTLASLSATDTQLVEQLLQPGMVSDALSPQDKLAHVLRWQKTLDDPGPQNDLPMEEPVQTKEQLTFSDPSSSILSRRMPCTLTTPTASLEITEPATENDIGGSVLDMNQTVYLLPGANANATVNRTRPLERSMSFEQRSLFLQQLSHSCSTSPATLLSLPLADLDNVRSDAERLGFHVRVLLSKGKDDDSDCKWVVLGTEDEAIDLLTEKFLEEEKKRGTRVESKGGKLTAVAGGVVFGAVATWAGLAFS